MKLLFLFVSVYAWVKPVGQVVVGLASRLGFNKSIFINLHPLHFSHLYMHKGDVKFMFVYEVMFIFVCSVAINKDYNLF